MCQVIEESLDSQSVTQHHLSNCGWSNISLRSLQRILSYLDKDDIVQLCIYFHSMSRSFNFDQGFYKATFVEYFSLHVLDEDDPE